MRILRVDDEPLQLLRLEKAVTSALNKEEEILSFSNPLKAWEECQDKQIDIAFLDIEMTGMNGIRLAKSLKGVNPKVNIVFVTAYDAYAFDALKIRASGYISKPVTKEKVLIELENLRNPVGENFSRGLKVKCFGSFEVFYGGVPVKFSYKKSKEAFAYLVDREGSAISVNELNAILWEEDHQSYLRNLIADIQSTLKKVGASDIFIKRHNECYIDITKVDCDAYEYKKDNPNAVRMYRGEYMIQYDWAFFHAE